LKHDLGKIRKLLGIENYEMTQWNLYEGFKEVSTLSKMRKNCWWEIANDSVLVRKFAEKIVGARWVRLPSPRQVSRKLFRQFNFAVNENYRLGKSRPYYKLKAAKRRVPSTDRDMLGKIAPYTLKLNLGDAVGYASQQGALNAAYFRKLVGDLSKYKKIAVVGVGSGDILNCLDGFNGEVVGIDISEAMLTYCLKLGLIDRAVLGNASDAKTWEQVGQCDLIICDYILDIVAKAVEMMKSMSEYLSEGGKIINTILSPIDQVGFDSLKPTENANRKVSVDSSQNIGNTKNPWLDVSKLSKKWKKYGIFLDLFSLVSYIQYDSGRKNKNLPLEVRPSFILVYSKKRSQVKRAKYGLHSYLN
jgi:2-polyprenyl-3-methyl-5-hydroxy-6-metoxy-1,4-benzoquinol methylase